MKGYKLLLWLLLLVFISVCGGSVTEPDDLGPTKAAEGASSSSSSSSPTDDPLQTTPPAMDVTHLYAELNAMKATLQGVTGELERFQGHFMKTVDDKLLQLITTVTGMDANIKTLQDRAHVWDIFKHHIDAWSDHMKSVDKKIDLIKRSHDTTFVVDSKLSALEAKTNHVYERVDMVNEKMHDMLKILYNLKVQRSASNCEILDVAITPRLANIEKQITLIQNNHCKTQPKRGRNHNNETQYSPPQLTMTHAEPAGKEVKQLLAVGKKSLNNLEYLSETVTSLNTTTNRLQKSLAICCRNNEVHVMMLRESVDSAFQKLERIYLNLEESIKSGRNHEKANRTKIELEDPSVTDPGEDIDGSGSGSGDKEWREREEAAVEADRSKKAAIKKQTFRSNCHELRGLEDGVYSFGFTDDENEQGRKFNHRYCHFDRDNSPGWTVIQRRGDFGGPENFNRSWADYKHGFGALDKEFWYGNDFIHQLTNEEGQVGLRVELLDFRGQRGVVQYSRFYVSSERSFYRLDIQGFGGNVSDSLLYHNQMYFSTFDSANDHSGDIPCALSHGSGWWWNNCLESNLNGKYSQDPHTTHYTGIIWEQWLGDYSLKATTMMIRPVAPNGLWIDNDEVDEVDDGPMMSPPEDP